MVSAEFQFARVEPVDRLSSTHEKSKKRQPFLCFDDVIAQINSRDTPFGETTAEMKATSKLRPPHPSAERPLQGVRGRFLSVNCPHADIASPNVPYFSSFTLF